MNALANQHKRVIACVVDTECCYINTEAHGLVFHFGAVFGDVSQEHTFETYNMDYYVEEVITHGENGYFKKKGTFKDMETGEIFEGLHLNQNPMFEKARKDAFKNPHKIKPWKEIMREFNRELVTRNVDYITSYNYNFDIGSNRKVGTIRLTHNQLSDKSFYMPRGIEHFDLMEISAICLANRTFRTWLNSLTLEEKEKMLTKKGNKSYSAQSMLRYLSKDLYYIEQHTALRDALCEFRLLMELWKNHKAIIKKHFVNNVQGVSRSDFENGVSVKQSLINRTKRAKGKMAKVGKKTKQLSLNLKGGK
jgi:hypothetical protein